MKKTHSRREFLQRGTTTFLACGVMSMCPRLTAMGNMFRGDDVPDPKKLEYCGYSCPSDCPLYAATIENNLEGKKEAYKNWNIKERYNLEFDPDQIFCYKCKNDEKPAGPVVANCTVRKCVIDKGLDCCIECSELPACSQTLWETFPDFHKAVIDLQKRYMAAKV
jgi:hypothetical protein